VRYGWLKRWVSEALIDLLIGVCTERSICANCGRGTPAQSAKDGQQDVVLMHNILRYAATQNNVTQTARVAELRIS